MLYVSEPPGVATARRAFAKVEASNRLGDGDYRTWVIVERASQQDIGLLALVAGKGMSEIGALILPEWHSDGVATEIIRRLVDFAFMKCGVETVFTRHRAENGGAEGLMRKLDFERIPVEGHREGRVRWERTRLRWQHAAQEDEQAVASPATN